MKKNTGVKTADIAQLAGVSAATVSRVFNHPAQVSEQTIRLVEDTMRSMGVTQRPASRQIARGKEIIMVNRPLGFNPFYEEIARGMLTSAAAHGFYLMFNYDNINEVSSDDFLRMIRKMNISGLITIGFVEAELLRRIRQSVPIVQCCEFNKEADLLYVSIDDYLATQQAVRYLIHAGRNKIAFVNGPLRFKYAKERLRGFEYAAAEASLQIPSGWMIQMPEIDYDMTFSTVTQLLNASEKPNAFFAASDVLAAASINAVIRQGLRVPEDVMVIGFDNISLCLATRPTITTVSQPKTQLGYTACEFLIESIRNPDTQTKSALLPTELILRESTEGHSIGF